MSGTTNISWTDATLNPYEWHCLAVSPGCDNCYARVRADRWHGRGYFEGGLPAIKERRLLLPFTNDKFRAGLRIFLTSMSDPFDARLSADDVALAWVLMAADQAHIYQVLDFSDHGLVRFGADLRDHVADMCGT